MNDRLQSARPAEALANEQGHKRRILLGLSYLVLALVTHASGLWQPMHADYAIRVRLAREWSQGSVLYKESYDNTQPVVFAWLRLIDQGPVEVTAFLADVLLAVVACLLWHQALRPAFSVAAWAAPAAILICSGISSTFYGGQITEGPALWFSVMGLSLCALAAQRGSWPMAFLAGLTLFAAVGFRLPAGLLLAATIPWLVHAAGVHSKRCAVGLAAVACAAGGVAVASVYWHAQTSGYWNEYQQVLARNFQYGSVSRVPLAVSALEGAKTVTRLLLENGAMTLLLGMAAWMFIRRFASTALSASVRVIAPEPQSRFAVTLPGTEQSQSCPELPSLSGRPRIDQAALGGRMSRAWLWCAAIWLIAAALSAVPGGRHYAHYYHVCWAPLCFFAVIWLESDWLGTAAGFRPRLAGGCVAALTAFGLLSQVTSLAKAQRDRQAGMHPRQAVAQACAYLQENCSAKQQVVLHVWGDWAELYTCFERKSPSLSVPHVIPQDRFGGWLKQTMRANPDWVVMDATPLGPIDADPNPVQTAAWEQWLSDGYALQAEMGALEIWQRSAPAPAESSAP